MESKNEIKRYISHLNSVLIKPNCLRFRITFLNKSGALSQERAIKSGLKKLGVYINREESTELSDGIVCEYTYERE